MAGVLAQISRLTRWREQWSLADQGRQKASVSWTGPIRAVSGVPYQRRARYVVQALGVGRGDVQLLHRRMIVILSAPGLGGDPKAHFENSSRGYSSYQGSLEYPFHKSITSDASGSVAQLEGRATQGSGIIL